MRSKDTIDQEWIELMVKAKQTGLTVDEVHIFLQQSSTTSLWGKMASASSEVLDSEK